MSEVYSMINPRTTVRQTTTPQDLISPLRGNEITMMTMTAIMVMTIMAMMLLGQMVTELAMMCTELESKSNKEI